MKFVLANWGTRGEVEPYVTVGRELVRRGHDVHMAVAPEMVGFTEAAGPTAVGYGPELKAILDPHRDFWAGLFANPWKLRELGRLSGEYSAPLSQCRPEVSGTLTSLAEGSDLLLTGMNFEDDALNVAEYCDIPLATLHIFPLRANGQLLPFLPAPFARSATRALDWLAWRGGKKVEDAQRRDLGLPQATRPWPRRISERGSLEIQAYDEVCYPGLAAEWAKWGGRRPFVGALTMELPTDADEEVAAWIAAGTPPICFGLGSTPVASPADMVAMIGAACARLGERALICSGPNDFRDVPPFDHVKVVGAVKHSAVLPACRAVVHHGGAGTTAAGMRAGIPTLILWLWLDQPVWAAALEQLGTGAGRQFVATTEESLVADLRAILTPECSARAREVSAQMTTPAESASKAADLLEGAASGA